MGCSRNLSLRRRDEPSPIARSLVVVLEGRRSQPASQSPPSWVIDPVTPCFARPPYNLLLGLHEIMPYQKPRHHQPGLQQNHDHRPSSTVPGTLGYLAQTYSCTSKISSTRFDASKKLVGRPGSLSSVPLRNYVGHIRKKHALLIRKK